MLQNRTDLFTPNTLPGLSPAALENLALCANPIPADETPAPDVPASPAGTSRSAAEPKGLLSWKTLAQVEEVKVNNRMAPKFSVQITALDSKEVRLQGFMMPLEPGMKQKRLETP